MKRMSALLLLLALTAGTSACAQDDSSKDEKTETDSGSDTGSDTGSSDEVAFDDWSERAQELCVTLDDDSAAIDEPDEEDSAEVADALAAQIEIFESFIADLKDLGTPDENADEVDDYIGYAEEALSLLEDALASAEDDDLEAAMDSMTEAKEVGDQASDVAEEIGLDDCVNDSDSTDTTDEDTDTTELGSGDLGDLGDLDDLGDLGTGDAMVDAIVQTYIDMGLTEEEAACLADVITTAMEEGTVDPANPDVSEMMDLVLECVPMERLMELSESGLGG